MQPATPDQLQALPRLLYIGDVPVQATVGGSALIHRLLHEYPASRLRIMEASDAPIHAEQRLPGVTYQRVELHQERWINSRMGRWYSLFIARRPNPPIRPLLDALQGEKPDAILTVAHGYAWFSAARLAKHLGVPLHLIVHDDWTQFTQAPTGMRSWISAGFARVYRDASTRLCVCDNMVQEYQRRYGVSGVALYPGRAPETFSHDSPPERLKQPLQSLRVGIAGTINAKAFAVLVRDTAEALAPTGGKVVIFGPTGREAFQGFGLDHPGLEFRGMVPSHLLIDRLREETDALLLPTSFAERGRMSMQMLFPSKLTDYTAAALPLIIWAPDYSSAADWARQYPQACEWVGKQQPEAILPAIQRLLEDPAHRVACGEAAAAAGRECFGYESKRDLFFETIRLG